jgi:hypothetical protein
MSLTWQKYYGNLRKNITLDILNKHHYITIILRTIKQFVYVCRRHGRAAGLQAGEQVFLAGVAVWTRASAVPPRADARAGARRHALLHHRRRGLTLLS